MDLIYANANHEDIGVLFDCTFDLAFGQDENNFELTMALGSHCMERGYYVFIEGTEYGGIVDGIRVDTEADTVTYCGRTWHGVLAGNIIEPDKGYDYLTVSGDANEILAQLITRLDLDGVFKASGETSPITVTKYQFRYQDGYSGIREMLAAFGGKLRMIHRYNRVVLFAENLVNYAQDEEWDSTQVDFEISKNFRPTNHLICLGGGDMKDRNVIHLFVDTGGGIMPYTTKDNPVEDADYILDQSQQVLFGADEVAAVYDHPQAETATNFVKLTEQPSDWYDNYGSYFKQDASGSFSPAQGGWLETYSVLTTKPSGWDTGYTNYFTLSDGQYRTAQGTETEEYCLLEREPSDWETNWWNYFTRFSDGLTESYNSVGGDSAADYKPQTMQPSDWETDFTKYYYQYTEWIWRTSYEPITEEVYRAVLEMEAAGKDPWTNGGYLSGVVNIYARNDGSVPDSMHFLTMTERPEDFDTNYSNYTQKVERVVQAKVSYRQVTRYQKWRAGKHYTKVSKSIAPKWEAGKYYTKVCGSSAPAFVSGVYYSFTRIFHRPSFASNGYYRKTFDHFKGLVNAGVERLKELRTGDSIKVALELEGDYDIGDIVGAHEQTTGVSVWQPITKKIVSIRDDQETITYEIGGI